MLFSISRERLIGPGSIATCPPFCIATPEAAPPFAVFKGWDLNREATVPSRSSLFNQEFNLESEQTGTHPDPLIRR